ncbi:MAG: PolC-type DNA polymerase III [Bacilli bacterium]
MKENNKKFLKLLETISLTPTNDLLEGHATLKMDKDNNHAELEFEFPQVLKIETFEKLIVASKNYFSKTKYNFEIRLKYKKKVIDSKNLENYYRYILEELSESKSRFSALNVFNTAFTDQEIKIFVGDSNDYVMVEELIDEVKQKMILYDIDCTIEIIKSNFEIPQKQRIQEVDKIQTANLISQQNIFDQKMAISEKVAQEKAGFPRIYKDRISGDIIAFDQLPADENELKDYNDIKKTKDCVIEGEIIKAELLEKKDCFLYEAVIGDGKRFVSAKRFLNAENKEFKYYKDKFVVGKRVKVLGFLEYDSRFSKDINLRIKKMEDLGNSNKLSYDDSALEKRVELHAHTKMSILDSVLEVKKYVETAKKYGHSALAITDHNNVHVFPEFDKLARENKIKPIYGIEASFVDDLNYRITYAEDSLDLATSIYVVYDIETTGLSSNYDEIIEIGAIKLQNGVEIDRFSEYIKPNKKINKKIEELTNISNDTVRNAERMEVIVPKFKKFCEGAILVAHNASFDNSFIYAALKTLGLYDGEFPTIDTLELTKARYSDKLKTFGLERVAKFFDYALEKHHRAIFDAEATAHIFRRILNDLLRDGINNLNDINMHLINDESYQKIHPDHITLLCKNYQGKVDLYSLISEAYVNYIYKEPRFLKSVLNNKRKNLLVGSSCYLGEVFDTAYRKSYEELLDIVEYYDYLEVQPPSVYSHFIERSGYEETKEDIKTTIKKIIKAGKEKNVIVVATGDVHHLHKEDKEFREVFVYSPQVGGGTHPLADITNIPSQHFMTTNEMLEEFSFLGKDLAYEIVVTNTNIIADQIEEFDLFPNELYAPQDDYLKNQDLPSFKEAVREMTYDKAYSLYGNPLPEYIDDRLKDELKNIINNGYASIYYISYLLVRNSIEAGYVVGSRGSVGSSLVAKLMGITEVNPLPPHYYCADCYFSAFKMTSFEKEKYINSEHYYLFEKDLDETKTGYDLPDANCPVCDSPLQKDGVDIPFETFLGLATAAKIPDIDLNFSSEFQDQAQMFCRTLLGENNTFKAGTIQTVQKETAYGYSRGYLERKKLTRRRVEIDIMSEKIMDVKRTTGQHPGGVVVVPSNITINEISPIQYPSDKLDSKWLITHFPYHSYEQNLLKLDILGQDDPTMIKHLMDYVYENPNEFNFNKVEDIPLADPKVLSLFNSLDALGLDSIDVLGEVVGTTGLPEFGTTLTKEILSEIRPTKLGDLIKISGLSHGTDVWRGNLREYMLGNKEGVPPIPFDELIGCRDDIMIYLISKGIKQKDAFRIMETVRKGQGISDSNQSLMIAQDVPKWFIDSCKAIKYLFPKAHATAYVIMCLRIAWFKVYKPIVYYAKYFTTRAKKFDAEIFVKGKDAIVEKINQIKELISKNEAKQNDIDLLDSLIVANEMVSRGFRFEQVDIYKSNIKDLLITEDKKGLILPFTSFDGLGESIAETIVMARKEKMFLSKRDIQLRTKITSTLFERMDILGVFKDLPDDDKITLF